jgi:hypothetical protein
MAESARAGANVFYRQLDLCLIHSQYSASGAARQSHRVRRIS